MTPEQWDQVGRFFESARGRMPDDRWTFLTEHCSDPEVRREVDSLLSENEELGDFLNELTLGAKSPPSVPAEAQETDTLPGVEVSAKDDTNPDYIGAVFGDRYKVDGKIGSGGMAVVYKAYDLQLHSKPVVVKVLKEKSYRSSWFERKFRQEIKVLARLNHPRVVGVSDTGQTPDGKPFFVMEYVEGRTLRSEIKPGGMEYERVAQIVRQVGQALSAAHRQEILHLDLKPENILLQDLGDGAVEVKLIDFGIAKVRDAEATTSGHSTQVAGTIDYMAPEQLMKKPTASSDIYALGVIAHEMITGARPFNPDSPFELLDLQRQGVRTRPSSLRPDLPLVAEKLICSAIEFEAQKRPPEAKGFAENLGRCLLGQGSISAVAPFAFPRFTSLRGYRRIAWTVALALLLSIALVFTYPAVWVWLYPPIPAQKNVVVLPLQPIGGGTDDRNYCNGLTETLTARLGRFQTVSVVPAQEVRTREVDSPRTARDEFGATLVLAGTWQRSDDRTRINLSLIEPSQSRQLRADTITADIENLFKLQDQVVAAAIRMLEIQAYPAELVETPSQFSTTPAAYDLYLRGRGYLQEYHKPENLEGAISLFHEVLEIDPDFALAYAGLGETYRKKYQYTNDVTWLNHARDACSKAVSRQDKISEVHTCLGLVYQEEGKYEQARAELERAVELDSNSDDALRALAAAYEQLGSFTGAENTYRRAIEIRPEYWGGYHDLGAFYARRTKFTEATKMFEQVVRLAPDSFRALYNLGAILILQGEDEEAIPLLQRSLQVRPSMEGLNNLGTAYINLRQYANAADTYKAALELDENDYLVWGNLGEALVRLPEKQVDALSAFENAISRGLGKLETNPRDWILLCALARYYAMIGSKETALEYLDGAIELSPNIAGIGYRAALVYMQLGQHNQAIAWIEKALTAGLPERDVLTTQDFDSLQADPRFRELLKDRRYRQQ